MYVKYKDIYLYDYCKCCPEYMHEYFVLDIVCRK